MEERRRSHFIFVTRSVQPVYGLGYIHLAGITHTFSSSFSTSFLSSNCCNLHNPFTFNIHPIILHSWHARLYPKHTYIHTRTTPPPCTVHQSNKRAYTICDLPQFTYFNIENCYRGRQFRNLHCPIRNYLYLWYLNSK